MKNESNWISCYIFHDSPFEKVLAEFIKPLIDDLKTKKMIMSFFFVRYWEKGPHIRLRISAQDITVKNKLIKLIQAKTSNYFDVIEGGNYSIEFNEYIHELQRYGGVENINVSQEHFNHSSEIVLNHISQTNKNWDYGLAMSIALQMHLIFAKRILISQDQALSYFQLLYNKVFVNSVKLDENNDASLEEIHKVKAFFVSSYKKQKNMIDHIARTIWLKKQEENWIDQWSLNCLELGEKIKNNYLNTKIPAPEWFEFNIKLNASKEKQILWSIYDSYIHMTNNRLGILLRDEAFIAFLIIKGLQSLKKDISS